MVRAPLRGNVRFQLSLSAESHTGCSYVRPLLGIASPPLMKFSGTSRPRFLQFSLQLFSGFGSNLNLLQISGCNPRRQFAHRPQANMCRVFRRSRRSEPYYLANRSGPPPSRFAPWGCDLAELDTARSCSIWFRLFRGTLSFFVAENDPPIIMAEGFRVATFYWVYALRVYACHEAIHAGVMASRTFSK